MNFRSLTLSATALTGLFFAVSCGGDSTAANDPNQIAFTNYESVAGWMDVQGSLTKDKAHSGAYSVKVDAANEYGMGYVFPLGKATPRKPRKVRIEGWAFKTDGKSNAKLALQIVDATTGQQKFSDDISFASQVKDAGKWVEISKDVTIPENTTSADMLKVFLWRAEAASPAYLDDLRISLAE